MKLTIRRNTFETNSSSTHAMCIVKDNNEYNLIVENLPTNSIIFEFKDFGWEYEKYYDIENKASYIYTLAYMVDDLENFKNKIFEWFNQDNLNVIFMKAKDSEFGNYVDHGNQALDFYNYVMRTKKHLYKYLFSDKSFIITANDNDDFDIDINVNYKHDEFYKGN